MPTVTYLKEDVALPAFLSFWPRLKRTTDVDTYVITRRRIKAQFDAEYRGMVAFASERKTAELKAFYTALRAALQL